MSVERFNQIAKQWDAKPQRVEGAMTFVNKIKECLDRDLSSSSLLDYGCGSGLVSFGFANDVQSILGLDNSSGMVAVYNEKSKKIGFKNIKAELHDIDKESLEENSFDIVVTNMTMHHIQDYKHFIKTLANSLKENGQLFIADLFSEDGTFHSDNTGVIHFGFEKEKLLKAFKEANLKDIHMEPLQTISKPHQNFEVFFITGRKK